MLYECLAVAVAIHHYLSLVILLLYAQEALLSSLFSLLSSLSLSLSLSRLYVSSAGWLLAARLSFVSLVVCV